MTTECTSTQLQFHPLGRRSVVAGFEGMQSSDGGALLLREVEQRTRIVQRLAAQFVDYRSPELIEHSVTDLLMQRVFGLALGYEDLNDHDALRLDHLLALAMGKEDPTGATRKRSQDRGLPLASSSTLNRLELTTLDATAQTRYKKIVANTAGMDELLVSAFLESYSQPPAQIWLDLDATDDPLHGNQEGRFFHGYYRHYCYLPLYIFCGEHLLCARLRSSNRDAAHGSVAELTWIVAQIRAQWPDTEIVIRGDSGFCRDDIMTWCEDNEVGFVLGLAKNERLKARLSQEMTTAEWYHAVSDQPCRLFNAFIYQTRDSWRRPRRVIGKAEHLAQGANPRFVVTSLAQVDPRALYEQLYCARGDMENRIKEQQLDLFADRTSTATLHANQLRLYFSSFAYVLMCALRRLGLAGTKFAKAQCGTIRLKLFKVAALLKITVRKVWVSFSEAYPYAAVFAEVLAKLRAPPESQPV